MTMSSILYASNNRFFVISDSGVDEYDSQMIRKYRENVESIKSRREWKTSGAGARFMGAHNPAGGGDVNDRTVHVNGAAAWGECLVYSATLGEVGGLYRKPLQNDAMEGHILASNDIQIHRISVAGDSCAASVGYGMERHIAEFDLHTGQYRVLTEGDVIEDYPCYASDGSKIFFSSAGIALSQEGIPMGIGPSGVLCYHHGSSDIEELFASDKYDYFAPKECRDGDMLFIKRPYKPIEQKGNVFLDILMFPLRIIRAIGGLLNFFSVMFGGEPLRSGQSGMDTKAKQQSEADLFIEGNRINAEETLKENERTGEKYPGIIPRSWELTKVDRSGRQICVKKGVMDYMVCDNGDIVYSNGAAVIRLSEDGSEQLVQKCRLATQLVGL
jgi:hypothetical protein